VLSSPARDFPLVSLGFYTVIPLMGSAHPLLKVLVLTLVVVPLAVYLVVPNLMKAYATLASRKAQKQRLTRHKTQKQAHNKK